MKKESKNVMPQDFFIYSLALNCGLLLNTIQLEPIYQFRSSYYPRPYFTFFASNVAID